MATRAATLLFVVAMVVVVRSSEAKLTPEFYHRSCPQIHHIVRTEVVKAVAAEARIAASLVRLHFHDCFVRGCDGSLLLDNTTTGYVSEKYALANLNSARGFEVIDTIKAALEQACPQTVSCADILAIASRDSAVAAGLVPPYPVFFGRRDGFPTEGNASVELANAFLPSPNFTYAQLKENFANVSLNERDLVALSGAHTIGRVNCAIIQRFSLSNNLQTNAEFRNFLNSSAICPLGSEIPLDPTQPFDNLTFRLTDLDLRTPDKFDGQYYQNLRRGEGMIPSDQTLQDTPGVNQAWVADFAFNRHHFFHQFAISTIKMGNIKPLEGDQGEIRLNCRRQNPSSPSLDEDQSSSRIATQ
jgi:peroxidase